VTVRRVVPDLRAERPLDCRAFYEDVIGLQLQMDMGWIATYVSPDNETAQITVMSADSTAPVTPNVSIEVDDIDAVHARAVAAGHDVMYGPVDEPWHVRRFFVRDPNGTIVNVMQHL
jgi:predicted enzyme related to lactoylglutathione lyase